MATSEQKWEEESRSIMDITAYNHIRIHYGWNEDEGYFIKVMDDRLQNNDDCDFVMDIDRFRGSILDGGQEGCYLSAHTGPRGNGKKVALWVMFDLWDIYKVPDEKQILSECRKMSKREVREFLDRAEEEEDLKNLWADWMSEDRKYRDESEESEEGDKGDQGDKNDKEEED